MGWVGEQGWRLLQSGLTLRPALSPLPGTSGSPAVGPLLTLPGPGIRWGGVTAPTTAQGVLGAKTGPDLP